MRWLLALLLFGGTAGAQGPTSTCVEILGQRADNADLKTLVMTELDRHPTHRAAESDCSGFLRVERLEVGSAQYLTGRINTQVPHREAIEGGDVARAVERMLRVLLHNDPIRLRGPRQEGWLRAGLRTLKEGRMLYGVEAFQLVAPLDGGVESVPGLAVTVRREVARWHLAGRIAYAGRLSGGGSDLHLTGHLGVQLHWMWFADPSGDTSFYLGGLAGLEHQRFEGPATLTGGDAGSTSATTFAAGGRLGVELLRTTTGRFDLFAQVVLPVSKSDDPDSGVVDAWVPTASLGAGVLF